MARKVGKKSLTASKVKRMSKAKTFLAAKSNGLKAERFSVAKSNESKTEAETFSNELKAERLPIVNSNVNSKVNRFRMAESNKSKTELKAEPVSEMFSKAEPVSETFSKAGEKEDSPKIVEKESPENKKTISTKVYTI
jgi:hypothetical protein